MFWRKKPSHWLDDTLSTFPDGTPWSVRECLRSTEVKGITGSGKSTGPRDTLVRAILGHPKATIFAVCQKPEDRDDYVAMLEGAGKPYVVVEPRGKAKCNFIEDELAAGADERALVGFYVHQGEALLAGMQNTGENAKYFRMLEDRILYNVFVALRLAGEKLTPENIREFIATAAYAAEQLSDEKWRAKYHNAVMQKAGKAAKDRGGIDAHDFDNVRSFFTNEFVHLDEKPKTGAISGLMNTAHVFCTGLAYDACATETTASPSIIDKGESIVVNYPFSIHGPTGRFVVGGWFYKLQKHILRRKFGTDSYFNVAVLDEYQECVTEHDATYLAQCRSHGGCLFTLTQTTHSEHSAMGGGHASHHKVGALTGNFGYHVFCQADAATAKAASEMLGMRLETFISMNEGEKVSAYDEMMGRSSFRASYSQQYQPVLQPVVFMHSLRSGGPLNDFEVDAVVVRSGQPFRCGRAYQFVTYRQHT